MRKGFTIIEIIVAVTIIGILTAMGSLAYQRAVRDSRDERRKVDIESIRSAAELYRSNNVNGAYPTTITVLDPDYLELPTDPLTGAAYPYTRLPAGCNNTSTFCTNYTIQITLESGTVYRVGPHGEF